VRTPKEHAGSRTARIPADVGGAAKRGTSEIFYTGASYASDREKQKLSGIPAYGPNGSIGA
jgi:hypothetical protein